MTNYILKPCPFCGSASGRNTFIDEHEIWETYIWCSNCQLEIHVRGKKRNETLKLAVEAWNRRENND